MKILPCKYSRVTLAAYSDDIVNSVANEPLQELVESMVRMATVLLLVPSNLQLEAGTIHTPRLLAQVELLLCSLLEP